MTNPYLPEEILIEIFSRLPAKSAGRCRCLSKLWQKNLSDSQFINLHLNRKKNHQEKTLLLINIKHGRSLHTIASPIDDNTTSKHLSLLPRNWVRVLGSCDGLVLLMNNQRELFLVNPILQQQIRVPHPPLPSHLKWNINHMYGFGYDISTDDYKIINLTTYCYGINQVRDKLAHVYSLKNGVWREVMCDFSYQGPGIIAAAHVNGGPGIASGAHVNGVIHWLVYFPHLLSSFNLADEVFGVIPLPTDYYEFHMASVFEGCLSLVSRERIINTAMVADLWTMKEYGVQESWTKMNFGISGLGNAEIKPLCFVGEKKLVSVAWNLLYLCPLDLETKKMKIMVVDGTKASIDDACVFCESLVSPNQLDVSR